MIDRESGRKKERDGAERARGFIKMRKGDFIFFISGEDFNVEKMCCGHITRTVGRY